MQKREEIRDPQSCLNRAGDDEQLFVLMGRDVAAPAAIRTWAMERLRRGKNQAGDAQIEEALRWANHAEGYITGRPDKEGWNALSALETLTESFAKEAIAKLLMLGVDLPAGYRLFILKSFEDRWIELRQAYMRNNNG